MFRVSVREYVELNAVKISTDGNADLISNYVSFRRHV